jgi:choline kinase/phosphoglycolate phosphatase-like HAD superfamily hydrolase/phosphatidylglycerophosphate synthase
VHGGAAQCLILAAGTGQRMHSFKPLVPVGGLPLIERVIATAHAAGLAEFFVVTGYQAARLEAFLADLSRRRGLRITCIRNANWQTENGASLLVGQPLLAGAPFVLLMGDHVVDEAIIQAVLREPMQDCDVVLAVDCRTAANRLVDPDDVTRVRVRGDRIEAIGKGLAAFNAFDTGVFRCTPAVFAAAQACVADGDASLSAAIRRLAGTGSVKALDVQGRLWVDVDTPADAKKADTALYAALGKPQDGFISAKLNRPLSTRVLTPLLLQVRRSLTPNQVSLLGFVVALAAALAFVLRLPVPGGLLIQLASLLDGSDGEVARLKRLQSRFGGFFDAVLDRYGDGFILFGMFYYALTSAASASLRGALATPVVLGSAMLALAGNFMVSYTSAKSVSDLGYQYGGGWLAAGRGRDLRLFVLALGGIGAVLHPVFVLLAIGSVAALVSAIVVGRVWVSWEHARGRSPFAEGPLQAVIFDFDGTVADTMPYLADEAVRLLTRHYAVSPSAARQGYLGTTGLDFASQLEQLFPQHPHNRTVAALMEEHKRRGLLDNALFPDVVPALHFFRERGVRVFICSSTRAEQVSQFVRQAGIAPLIDRCSGYGVGFTKQHQIERILHDYELAPPDVIFVGDSLADHDFARAAGVRFVGLARMVPAASFRQRGVLSVRDLTALTRFYQRWEKRLRFVGQTRREATPTPRSSLQA